MAYMIAMGNNNTGGLATITPQPRCRGIKWERQIGGDLLTYQDGYGSAKLEYGYHHPNRRDLTDLLTQLGLTGGTVSRPVTIKLRNNGTNTFGNYNAVITLPDYPNEAGYEMSAWQPIVFELTGIEAI